MKKKTILNIVITIAFWVILALLLLRISNVIEQKNSRYSKMPLYSQTEQIDVLLCGSSHIQDGVYPYYLWNDYGIASYNIASSGERINVSVYVLEEILKTVHPKVVVLDTYFARIKTDDEITMNDGLIHESMDFMPLDNVKINLAKYAIKGRDLNVLAFLSNFYAYHGRWKELTKDDFVEQFTLEKGAVSLSGGKALPEYDFEQPLYDETYLELAGYEYVQRIKKLCDENGVSLVLINVPYNNNSQESYNREYTQISDHISQGGYGIFFPDIEGEIGLDSAVDYGDSSHLNILGAKKVSDYIGDYLIRNNLVTDHRNDENYSAYYNFDADFELARINRAMKARDAYSMIMYFYDSKNYYVEVCTANNKIRDEQIEDYILSNSIIVSDYDQATEDTLEFVNGKLIEDDFSSKTMAVLIRNKEDDRIIDGRLFEYNEGYN